MGTGLITLVLVDAILYLLINLVRTQYAEKEENVPLLYSIMLLVLACVGHFAATKTMQRFALPDPNRDFSQMNVQLVMGASIVCGFIPIWAYVHMLTTRFAPKTAVAPSPDDDFPRVKKPLIVGDVEGALQEYLRYWEKSPDSPAPLFRAVDLLVDQEDYKRAASLLKKIMGHFDANDQAWARAAYMLAYFRERKLNDAEGAEFIRAQIAERVPTDLQGRYEQAYPPLSNY